jgi:thiosulfate reductase / polysulfide reductase chain A
MEETSVFSLCFMCSIRCPIRVTVKNGQVSWIEGNDNVEGLGKSLCPRGAAGISLLNDIQRVQTPLIREGERGAGKWRKASWDEALHYVAEKLNAIRKSDGPESIVFGERTNLSTHVSKTFMKALGSPNHFTHDALCKGSANTAFRSMFGYTDAEMGVDIKNAKHIILYGRNMLEAIEVKPVRALMSAIESGSKLTYIDPRVSVTATKAHDYWMIRPGTDLALNYALMHVILEEGLFDRDFANKWITGLEELRKFTAAFTPQWAAEETGIAADRIKTLAREAAGCKPNVLFHPGYRAAHHINEIYLRRSILMLNALMGNIESPGGLFFKKGPGAVGKDGIRKLTDQSIPKPEACRFDKCGLAAYPLPDPAHGLPQMLPYAIINADPYPIKALIANRFDPVSSMPDANATRKALEKLDLIVSIDINFSEIAGISDVILPESIYLERTDCVQAANGMKPQLYLRRQAVPPRYDTMEAAMILKKLADRLGIGNYFPYNSMDELVDWQLEGTGFTRSDFAEKGFVSYSKTPIRWDRETGLKLKTPSGRIEFKSSLLENAGFPSFPEYESVPGVDDKDSFRLITGRMAAHTHVSTQNNPYLNELFPENVVWIHKDRAAALDISDGDRVRVFSEHGEGELKAYVSSLIHPDAAFLVHGFGHRVVQAGRSYNRGVSDADLIQNVTDPVGGSPGLHETFIKIEKMRIAERGMSLLGAHR